MVYPGLAVGIGLMIVLILYVFRETLNLTWRKLAILTSSIFVINLAFPYLYDSLDPHYLLSVLFSAIILVTAVTLLPEKKRYVPRVATVLDIDVIDKEMSPNQDQMINVNDQVAATLHQDFEHTETPKNMLMNSVDQNLIEEIDILPDQKELSVLESQGLVMEAADPLLVEEDYFFTNQKNDRVADEDPSEIKQELHVEDFRSNIADLLTEEENRRKIDDIQ